MSDLNHQCAGFGWKSACKNGLECVKKDSFYSQCLDLKSPKRKNMLLSIWNRIVHAQRISDVPTTVPAFNPTATNTLNEKPFATISVPVSRLEVRLDGIAENSNQIINISSPVRAASTPHTIERPQKPKLIAIQSETSSKTVPIRTASIIIQATPVESLNPIESNSDSISSLAIAAFCTPYGAPGCGINTFKITMGMGRESDLKYRLDVQPYGGNSWKISILGPRMEYQGLLLYVSRINTPTVHLGQIVFKDCKKWKYQAVEKCSEQGIVSGAKGTVTHANPDRVSNVEFLWIGSDEEVAMEGLVVHAVVATLDKGKTGKAKWQKLDYFGIPPTVRSNLSTTDTVSQTSQAAQATLTDSIIFSQSSDYPTATAFDISATTSTSPQTTHTVLIGPGLSFSPPVLLANPGDKVQWNFTSTPHTITESIGCIPIPGGFDSGNREFPESFEIVVQDRVEYMCTVGNHCESGMRGIVELQSLENGSSSKNCIALLLLSLCFL